MPAHSRTFPKPPPTHTHTLNPTHIPVPKIALAKTCPPTAPFSPPRMIYTFGVILDAKKDASLEELHVHNTTTCTFSVVASAFSILSLLPWLKAIRCSKKSQQARHGSIQVIQQIAIMKGCTILSHLRNLVARIAQSAG
ncbi:hypothetical protein K503DRAFT_798527 [Rhizopogon vinicolor AM-OR11-026]|uniref:Uncharacterized protein n=1 Tax=Rhizopogon vinicolor AM-OR11-026 TaxID=1314800 RepID=A0A1B7N7J1_9AGAM|nr:hypothetical protein K503DRAFT_798527 [Rhizopogon vinicolor AM-OR11-026]